MRVGGDSGEGWDVKAEAPVDGARLAGAVVEWCEESVVAEGAGAEGDFEGQGRGDGGGGHDFGFRFLILD